MEKILITGVSKGLGLSCCTVFLKKKYKVFGVSRSKPPEAILKNKNFTWLAGDINDEIFLQKVNREINELDIIIFNAGVGYFKKIDSISSNEIKNTINTNLLSPILWCQKLINKIKKNVIFISSESAFKGDQFGTVYCATKSGIKIFAEGLWEEKRNTGLKINIIYPSFINTSWFDNKDFKPQEGQEFVLDSYEIANNIYNIVQNKNGNIFEIKILPQKKCIIKK